MVLSIALTVVFTFVGGWLVKYAIFDIVECYGDIGHANEGFSLHRFWHSLSDETVIAFLVGAFILAVICLAWLA